VEYWSDGVLECWKKDITPLALTLILIKKGHPISTAWDALSI
jgi:hypothetical protein